MEIKGFRADYHAYVDRTISPHDEMYYPTESSDQHYWSVGESALHVITAALMTAGTSRVDTVLDLPCGHGRVLRTLKAAFPDAHFYACDINRDGVDFCAETFGAQPVYSVPDFDALPLDAHFDLIWSGSLVTHLSEEQFARFFAFCIAHLNDNGVLVFSFHGRFSVGLQEHGKLLYMADEAFQTVRRQYERTGYGYADYPGQTGYGISITKPSRLLAHIEEYESLRAVLLTERGWDNHQDIFACTKRSIIEL